MTRATGATSCSTSTSGRSQVPDVRDGERNRRRSSPAPGPDRTGSSRRPRDSRPPLRRRQPRAGGSGRLPPRRLASAHRATPERRSRAGLADPATTRCRRWWWRSARLARRACSWARSSSAGCSRRPPSAADAVDRDHRSTAGGQVVGPTLHQLAPTPRGRVAGSPYWRCPGSYWAVADRPIGQLTPVPPWPQ